MYQVGAVPFPRHVSLWYRVDRWRPGNAVQYVFFAVLVGSGGTSYQIRYFLSGVDAMPYRDNGNVRFVLVRPGAPPQGTWVHFTADLHQDFLQRWGRVPSSFERLSFAVEARYEAPTKLNESIEADVTFDDVFVGWTPAPG